MSHVAIRVENLSKSYKIRHQQTAKRYATLREDLMKLPAALMGKLHNQEETFWALDDVSFEIHEGEVVGIIGRNGAGKSTLLKILARITEPTRGRAEIFGRVGSLLEVGTGFHPELTGRENIYLSGAILGMTRAEIRRKFDEIVDFAEVEKFLDTPAKHYSSGMYVRLAFAVAAHLDPEILLVDEVLAVGDAQFQKKCLGKMGEVAQGGRTVLFVSHNMGAVRQLCAKGILLHAGKINIYDHVENVVSQYLNQVTVNTNDLEKFEHRSGNGEIRIVWAELIDHAGVPRRTFSIGESLSVIFRSKIQATYQNQRVKFSVVIRTSDGLVLCNSVTSDSNFDFEYPEIEDTFQVEFEDIRFYPGRYFVSLWVGGVTGVDTYDLVEDCLGFDIEDGGKMTTRSLPRYSGLLFLTPNWKKL